MKKLVVKMIEKYQTNISSATPSTCRFTPTCSNYTKDAVLKYGVIIGLVKGLKRFIICNNLGPSGYDPA